MEKASTDKTRNARQRIEEMEGTRKDIGGSSYFLFDERILSASYVVLAHFPFLARRDAILAETREAG